MNLSPANKQGLFTNLLNPAEPTDPKERVEEFTAYRCLECSSVHEDEDDAMDCCEPPGNTSGDENKCPVCLEGAANARDASDCCLWKDLDAPTRWQMADRVEAGASWAEVLGIH